MSEPIRTSCIDQFSFRYDPDLRIFEIEFNHMNIIRISSNDPQDIIDAAKIAMSYFVEKEVSKILFQ